MSGSCWGHIVAAPFSRRSHGREDPAIVLAAVPAGGHAGPALWQVECAHESAAAAVFADDESAQVPLLLQRPSGADPQRAWAALCCYVEVTPKRPTLVVGDAEAMLWELRLRAGSDAADVAALAQKAVQEIVAHHSGRVPDWRSAPWHASLSAPVPQSTCSTM